MSIIIVNINIIIIHIIIDIRFEMLNNIIISKIRFSFISYNI